MSRIPVSLDPFQPRSLNQQWEGDYDRSDLPRVASVAPNDAPLAVHVSFGLARGQLGEVRLQGWIAGALELCCQRCLQPMTWRFRLQSDAVLLGPEGSPGALGEDRDVVEIGADGLFRPAEFVEEEILLALPLSPRHDDCDQERRREFEPGAVSHGSADSPFAVLGDLRKRS